LYVVVPKIKRDEEEVAHTRWPFNGL
jgi:hypothetical protein